MLLAMTCQIIHGDNRPLFLRSFLLWTVASSVAPVAASVTSTSVATTATTLTSLTAFLATLLTGITLRCRWFATTWLACRNLSFWLRALFLCWLLLFLLALACLVEPVDRIITYCSHELRCRWDIVNLERLRLLATAVHLDDLPYILCIKRIEVCKG